MCPIKSGAIIDQTPAPAKAKINEEISTAEEQKRSAYVIFLNLKVRRSCPIGVYEKVSTINFKEITIKRGQRTGIFHQYATNEPQINMKIRKKKADINESKEQANINDLEGLTNPIKESMEAPG